MSCLLLSSGRGRDGESTTATGSGGPHPWPRRAWLVRRPPGGRAHTHDHHDDASVALHGPIIVDYLPKRLRRSWRPLPDLPDSRSLSNVPGATRTEGEEVVPVTLALISPRPWLIVMSRFMRPLPLRYPPPSGPFFAGLLWSGP